MATNDTRPDDTGPDDTRPAGVWRDEERLPLADLVDAVATSADDGQTDDESGNDAGIQQTLDEDGGATARPDFTGRTGPH
ncbi:hypothetical protein [Dactylosporangium matsuzakiense]|uniref:Uncharacterized protein n=1 Tax=Dactylosporangium matsuzakiense TaxID=53360 RepID=A0A9W6KIJ6_9ACTN|nr:hypothetical protein [Dactylosporangium matsuzakiense]UWZ48744.1 hypothetical protein Dmats_21485 [Dactylosporangium matsuzakiense]GLL01159.1 hypothetical protein GCM10017581_029000 [Dactylosporangium matsuzakiense]